MFLPVQSGPKRACFTIALPIHPLVTVEAWVAAAHFLLLDGDLDTQESIDLVMAIEADPVTAALFGQACVDEEMMRVCFDVDTDRSLAH